MPASAICNKLQPWLTSLLRSVDVFSHLTHKFAGTELVSFDQKVERENRLQWDVYDIGLTSGCASNMCEVEFRVQGNLLERDPASLHRK